MLTLPYREGRNLLRGGFRKSCVTSVEHMLALALVRLLEIIGEAAKNVPTKIREASPQIPWSLVARTRDRLAHGYFDINLDRVWEMVSNDLPPLIKALEAIPLLSDPSNIIPKP